MALDFRVGHGYDVHRFAEGRQLYLGGVCIPNERGLLGHSDADVLIHAIADAMLGAAGLGDIGKHFPDTDAYYKDISSLKLLEKTVSITAAAGWAAANIDATVVAERPKISSYKNEMTANIAKTLKTEEQAVNIKATTEEGLGFTGRGEGIAAYAVCLMERTREGVN